MRAKAPSAESVAQGAAVVVTNFKKKATLFALLTFTVLGYQNCMVELSPNTPGAASTSCSPDSTALSEFQVVESTILQPTGTLSGGKDACGSCHGETASSSGKAVFLILGTAGVTDNTVSTKNFCTMYLKGATRLAHPQDASHSGGQYSTSDIPDYYTLINKYF